MRSSTESGPMVHLFVVLATATVALLIFAGGMRGIRDFLILGTPWVLGLLVLYVLFLALRKAFRKPDAPFVPSARSLHFRTGTSPDSLKMGRFTVMEDGPKDQDPFQRKD